MNIISLDNLELKTFTEQNVLDYCQINNINQDNIIILNLYNNELTDISNIKYLNKLETLNISFNKIEDISVIKDLNSLKILHIGDNKIEDISVIQYLIELNSLNINYLKLKSDQIQYIKLLNNLKELYCENGFKDMSVLNQLNKDINIYE